MWNNCIGSQSNTVERKVNYLQSITRSDRFFRAKHYIGFNTYCTIQNLSVQILLLYAKRTVSRETSLNIIISYEGVPVAQIKGKHKLNKYHFNTG
jgi:hypothetical protein